MHYQEEMASSINTLLGLRPIKALLPLRRLNPTYQENATPRPPGSSVTQEVVVVVEQNLKFRTRSLLKNKFLFLLSILAYLNYRVNQLLEYSLARFCWK